MYEETVSAGFSRSPALRYNHGGLPVHREWRMEQRGTAQPTPPPRGSWTLDGGQPARIARISWKRGTMRTRPVVILLLALLVAAASAAGSLAGAPLPMQDQGQYPDPNQEQNQYPDQEADQYQYQNFSAEQLDNLLAPIALYPDPLLAQVLVAATFPDQVDEAARFLRAGADPNAVDGQPWDVSVKSVAHYPTVLYMMDNRLDWTTSVGQAYVNQSTDVQESIQRLRTLANNAGTLVSGPQIEVVQQNGYWCIWPVQPQYIYVPVYDPAFVYYRRPGWVGPYITFGVGYRIGAWLNLGFAWGGPGVYYFGWGGVLPPWAVRARPYVHINNVYVNSRYRTVYVNREVVHRRVNYENLNRYNGVHREVNYSNLAKRNYAGGAAHPVERPNQAPRPVPNQTVQRNIDTRDSRIQDFRGREGPGPKMTIEGQGRPEKPQAAAPEQGRPEKPQAAPEQGRPAPQGGGERPEGQRPAPQRPRPVPPEVRTPERGSQPTAFNTERGTFDNRQTSQRGQESRQEMNRPAPAPKPSHPPKPPSGERPSGGKQKP